MSSSSLSTATVEASSPPSSLSIMQSLSSSSQSSSADFTNAKLQQGEEVNQINQELSNEQQQQQQQQNNTIHDSSNDLIEISDSDSSSPSTPSAMQPSSSSSSASSSPNPSSAKPKGGQPNQINQEQSNDHQQQNSTIHNSSNDLIVLSDTDSDNILTENNQEAHLNKSLVDQTNQAMRYHVSIKHEIDYDELEVIIPKCHKCGRLFNRPEELQSHLADHAKTGYRCTWKGCGYFYLATNSLERHITREHLKDNSQFAKRKASQFVEVLNPDGTCRKVIKKKRRIKKWYQTCRKKKKSNNPKTEKQKPVKEISIGPKSTNETETASTTVPAIRELHTRSAKNGIPMTRGIFDYLNHRNSGIKEKKLMSVNIVSNAGFRKCAPFDSMDEGIIAYENDQKYRKVKGQPIEGIHPFMYRPNTNVPKRIKPVNVLEVPRKKKQRKLVTSKPQPEPSAAASATATSTQHETTPTISNAIETSLMAQTFSLLDSLQTNDNPPVTFLTHNYVVEVPRKRMKRSNCACKHCGRNTFNDIQELASHIEHHSTSPGFRCLKCGFFYPFDTDAQTHVVEDHFRDDSMLTGRDPMDFLVSIKAGTYLTLKKGLECVELPSATSYNAPESIVSSFEVENCLASPQSSTTNDMNEEMNSQLLMNSTSSKIIDGDELAVPENPTTEIHELASTAAIHDPNTSTWEMNPSCATSLAQASPLFDNLQTDKIPANVSESQVTTNTTSNHAALRFQCCVCIRKTFKTIQSRSYHYRKAHSELLPHYCKYSDCSYVCFKKSNCVDHIRSEHLSVDQTRVTDFVGTRSLVNCVCRHCGLTLEKLNLLEEHIQAHNTSSGYRCLVNECGFFFALCADARSHIKERHFKDDPMMVAEQIPMHFLEPIEPGTYLVQQAELVAETPSRAPYIQKCDICAETFTNSTLNSKHYLSKHPEKLPYHCAWPACTFASFGPNFMRAHIQRDHPIGNKNAADYVRLQFVQGRTCPQCGRTMEGKKKLKIHLLSHTKSGHRCLIDGCGYFYPVKSPIARSHVKDHFRREPERFAGRKLRDFLELIKPAKQVIQVPDQTTFAYEPVPATSSHEFNPTTSAYEPAPTTSTYEPAPTTSTYELAPTTSAYEPAPTTSTYEPAPTTSTYEPAPTTSAYEPAPTTSTYEPAPTTSTYEPAPTTSAYEPAPTTSAYEPAPTTSAYEPAPTTSTYELNPTTSTYEPAPTTSAYEPAPTTSTYEPAPTTAILEPGSSNSLQFQPAATASASLVNCIEQRDDGKGELMIEEKLSFHENPHNAIETRLLEQTFPLLDEPPAKIVNAHEGGEHVESHSTSSSGYLCRANDCGLIYSFYLNAINHIEEDHKDDPAIAGRDPAKSLLKVMLVTDLTHNGGLECVELPSAVSSNAPECIVSSSEVDCKARICPSMNEAMNKYFLVMDPTSNIIADGDELAVLENPSSTIEKTPLTQASPLLDDLPTDKATQTNVSESQITDLILNKILKYQCCICINKRFKSLSSRCEHYRAAHSELLPRYCKWPDCSYVCFRSNKCEKHIRSKHPIGGFTDTDVMNCIGIRSIVNCVCKLCGLAVESINMLEKHVEAHNISASNQCRVNPDVEDFVGSLANQDSVPTTSNPEPNPTTSIIEPNPTTSHQAPNLTTSIIEPNPTTSHQAPNLTTSIIEPNPTTSIIEPNPTTSHQAPNLTTSVIEPNPTTSHQAPNLTTSIIEPNPTTSIIEPNLTTSHQAPNLTTSIIEPNPTTSIIVPNPTTSIIEPNPTTSIIVPNPTTSIIEPNPTTSHQAPNLTTSIIEPNPTTSIIEPNPTTSHQAPNLTTSVIEPNPTTSHQAPNLTTSIIEPNPTTSIIEPNLTTSHQAPNLTTSIIEPNPTTSIIVPNPTTSIIEPNPTTSIIVPNPTTSIIEPNPTTSHQAPNLTTSIIEPNPTSSHQAPNLTTSIIEPDPITSPVVEQTNIITATNGTNRSETILPVTKSSIQMLPSSCSNRVDTQLTLNQTNLISTMDPSSSLNNNSQQQQQQKSIRITSPLNLYLIDKTIYVLVPAPGTCGKFTLVPVPSNVAISILNKVPNGKNILQIVSSVSTTASATIPSTQSFEQNSAQIDLPPTTSAMSDKPSQIVDEIVEPIEAESNVVATSPQSQPENFVMNQVNEDHLYDDDDDTVESSNDDQSMEFENVIDYEESKVEEMECEETDAETEIVEEDGGMEDQNEVGMDEETDKVDEGAEMEEKGGNEQVEVNVLNPSTSTNSSSKPTTTERAHDHFCFECHHEVNDSETFLHCSLCPLTYHSWCVERANLFNKQKLAIERYNALEQKPHDEDIEKLTTETHVCDECVLKIVGKHFNRTKDGFSALESGAFKVDIVNTFHNIANLLIITGKSWKFPGSEKLFKSSKLRSKKKSQHKSTEILKEMDLKTILSKKDKYESMDEFLFDVKLIVHNRTISSEHNTDTVEQLSKLLALAREEAQHILLCDSCNRLYYGEAVENLPKKSYPNTTYGPVFQMGCQNPHTVVWTKIGNKWFPAKVFRNYTECSWEVSMDLVKVVTFGPQKFQTVKPSKLYEYSNKVPEKGKIDTEDQRSAVKEANFYLETLDSNFFDCPKHENARRYERGNLYINTKPDANQLPVADQNDATGKNIEWNCQVCGRPTVDRKFDSCTVAYCSEKCKNTFLRAKK